MPDHIFSTQPDFDELLRWLRWKLDDQAGELGNSEIYQRLFDALSAAEEGAFRRGLAR
jgi:hypothetical protein